MLMRKTSSVFLVVCLMVSLMCFIGNISSLKLIRRNTDSSAATWFDDVDTVSSLDHITVDPKEDTVDEEGEDDGDNATADHQRTSTKSTNHRRDPTSTVPPMTWFGGATSKDSIEGSSSTTTRTRTSKQLEIIGKDSSVASGESPSKERSLYSQPKTPSSSVGKTEEVNYWQTDGVNNGPSDVNRQGAATTFTESGETKDEPVSVKEHDKTPHGSSVLFAGDGWFSSGGGGGGSGSVGDGGWWSFSKPQNGGVRTPIAAFVPVLVADYEGKDQNSNKQKDIDVVIKEHDDVPVNSGSSGSFFGSSSPSRQWFGGSGSTDDSPVPPTKTQGPTGGGGSEDVWFGINGGGNSGNEWQPVGSPSHRQQRRMGFNGDGETLATKNGSTSNTTTTTSSKDYYDIITASPDHGTARDVFTFVVESSLGKGRDNGNGKPNVKVINKMDSSGSTVLSLEDNSDVDIITAAPSKKTRADFGWLSDPKTMDSDSQETDTATTFKTISTTAKFTKTTTVSTSTMSPPTQNTSTTTMARPRKPTRILIVSPVSKISNESVSYTTKSISEENTSTPVKVQEPSPNVTTTNKPLVNVSTVKINVTDDIVQDSDNAITSTSLPMTFSPWKPMTDKTTDNANGTISINGDVKIQKPQLHSVFYTAVNGGENETRDQHVTVVRLDSPIENLNPDSFPNGTYDSGVRAREGRNFNDATDGGRDMENISFSDSDINLSDEKQSPANTNWTAAAASAAADGTRNINPSHGGNSNGPASSGSYSRGLSSEALSYVLIGVCCGISLVCLIAVLAIVRCRRAYSHREQERNLQKPFPHTQLYSTGYASYPAPPSPRESQTGHVAPSGWLDRAYGSGGHSRDGGVKKRPESEVPSEAASKARFWFMGRKQSPYSLCDQHLGYCGNPAYTHDTPPIDYNIDSKPVSTSSGTHSPKKLSTSATNDSDLHTSGSSPKPPVYRSHYDGGCNIRHSSGLESMNKGEMIYWSSNNEQLI